MGFWGDAAKWGSGLGVVGAAGNALAGHNDYAGDHPTMDEGNFQWGGDAGGEARDIAGYDAAGALAQGRQGVTADMGQANADYGRSLQDRGAQGEGLDAYRQAMNGAGPSVAAQQMARGTDQSINAQMAMANSGHGGGLAAAAAQRGAQNAGGNMMQQNVQNTGILRAQEIAQARQGFGGMANSMRGADQAERGMSQAQGFGQADLQARQRALNDAATQSYLGARMGTRQGALQGRMGMEGVKAGVAQQNVQGQNDMMMGMMGAGASGFGAAMKGTSDANAKTDINNVGTYNYDRHAPPPKRAKSLLAHMQDATRGATPAYTAPDTRGDRADDAASWAEADKLAGVNQPTPGAPRATGGYAEEGKFNQSMGDEYREANHREPEKLSLGFLSSDVDRRSLLGKAMTSDGRAKHDLCSCGSK